MLVEDYRGINESPQLSRRLYGGYTQSTWHFTYFDHAYLKNSMAYKLIFRQDAYDKARSLVA